MTPAPEGPDAIDIDRLGRWLTLVTGGDGREHAVLSDGWRRIRLDVDGGTLRQGGLVLLQYRLQGVRSSAPKLLPLRRLLVLAQAGRFTATLFPPDRRMRRWIDLLRVGDARASGASYRDIAVALYGEDRTRRDWNDAGRSLHSRVRRLVAGARAMASGGYRELLKTPDRGQSSASPIKDSDPG